MTGGPAGAGGVERRKHPRVVVSAPAWLKADDDEVILCQLRDVCRDAALVEADRWLPLQTEVEVTLELPAGGVLKVRGTIIRLAPGEQGTHGMAILFKDISDAAADRIDAFISGGAA